MIFLFIIFAISAASFFIGISYSDMIFKRCLSQSYEMWDEQPSKAVSLAFNVSRTNTL